MNKSDRHIALWDECRRIIRGHIGLELYNLWFKPVKSVSFDNGIVTLKVPQEFFKEVYEERFYNLLVKTMQQVYGSGVKLYYQYDIIKDDAGSSVVVGATRNTLPHGKKQKNEASVLNPFDAGNYADIDPHLIPSLSFENYCVGESNKLPHSIAQYIASNPNKREFNPFFLYGSVGVGKTHLIQAIGLKIKEDRPSTRVLYITSKIFENHVALAYMRDKVPDLINFYQSLDVLLIDDIQEISRKKANQEALFAIFNYLHQNSKILIFTSDRAPIEMEDVSERLIDRFKWGVTEKLEKPDYELRRDILDFKAERNGLALSQDVIDIIAQRVTGSIRELEGVVMSLMTRAIMTNGSITKDMALSVIKNSCISPIRKINFDMIVDETADYFNLSPDAIFGNSRQRDIAEARQVIMYLCRKLTDLSTPAIGHRLNRAHTTVLHGIEVVENRMNNDQSLVESVDAITNKLSV